MPNTDQNDSPPSLNPDNQPEGLKNIPIEQADSPGVRPSRAVKSVGEGIKIDTSGVENRSPSEAMEDSVNGGQEGSDVPFANDAEEAQFIEVNGGPSGRMDTPEEVSEVRVAALDSVQGRVRASLQEFRKITKQSHTVDRLLGCLTPTASMPDRLPFTPSASLHLESRNRDDHILHLAGLIVESWGIIVRDERLTGQRDIDSLQNLVMRLEDVVRGPRLFKAYPVDPRSSLFTLRRIAHQAVLNAEAGAKETERANRLSGEAD